MKKILSAIVMSVAMLFGLLFVLGNPASAVTYSNCVRYATEVNFDDYYASIYPGKLADAQVRVSWNNCLASDGSASRNNAMYAIFYVKCDNPNWINGLVFDLGNIEGMDLPEKFVPCDGTNWNSRDYSIQTPGYTWSSKNFYFRHRRDDTAFARAQFVPETWNSHGPFLWGGRGDRTYWD